MHKLESILEYETHTILLDFEIEMDHPVPFTRQDQVLITKEKICELENVVVPKR